MNVPTMSEASGRFLSGQDIHPVDIPATYREDETPTMDLELRLATVQRVQYTIIAAIPDDLLDRLELHCRRAALLERRTVYQSPPPAFESPAKPWSLEREESIFAFLHTVRPFILQSDWLFFPAVANELKRWIRDSRFRSVNGNVLDEEKQLDNWLQGYEYHVTPKRRPDVHLLVDEQATAQLFLPTLFFRAHAAVAMASVGSIILRSAGRSA